MPAISTALPTHAGRSCPAVGRLDYAGSQEEARIDGQRKTNGRATGRSRPQRLGGRFSGRPRLLAAAGLPAMRRALRHRSADGLPAMPRSDARRLS